MREQLISEAQANGKTGTSYVNGHIRVARAMLTWALNHIEGLGLQSNPFMGISLGKEPRKNRYVTDQEYEEQYLFAIDNAPGYLPLVFEHAYLLACRSIEVTTLTVPDANEIGYLVHRTKGSKDNIITYTERLRAAREAAMANRATTNCKSDLLLPSTRGTQLTKDTLQSAMQKLKKKMHKAGKSDICWDLHDLKRKGISDAENAKIGGHKSENILQRYLVKLESYKASA